MRNSSLLREYGRRIAGVAAFAVIWVLSQATVRSDPPAGSGGPPSLHPELALQIGHVGMVWCVAFSPDGKTLASGSWDKTLKLWDVETGSVRRALTKHEGGVNTVAFSPDGTLASGGYDGVVRLWDAATGELKRTLTGHTQTVRSVAFSPDGTMLVSGSEDRTVRLWDVGTGRLRRTFTGHEGEVSSVAFAPDGRTVASGSVDKTVKLWDVNTGSLHRTLTGHGGEVNSVAFAPDGRSIASGSNDRTVRLWDLATGSVRRTLMGHGGEVTSVAYAPDGRMLASGSLDTTVKLWDVNTGSVLRTLPGNKDAVLSVAFAPHGRTLASGVGMGEMFSQRGSAVMLWDVATGRVTRTLRGHQGWVRSVAIAPDGKSFASASSDTTVKLWDAATGELRATLAGHEGAVHSVDFSPDGETLASGSADGTVKLWDVETRSVRRTLKGHAGSVNSVAFTPDGRTVVSGSTDGTVRLWDARTGDLDRTLTGHGAAVWCVACSPDGRTLASGSENQTVKLWNAQTGSVLRTLPEHSAGVWTLAFSPDGKTLATGDYSVVKLWDTATGQLQRELTGHHYWLFSLAFAPDGKTLASGNYDKTIKLWDLETGRLKQTLTGHESGIWAVPFSSDGKTLVSGSFDTTIRLWDLSANAAQAPMSARHRATLIALPPREGESISNDALILTPEGYYDSTPGAARFIKWRVANDLFPVEAYERVFYRPQLVRKALRGEAVPRAERDVERFLAGQLIPPQVTFAIPHDGQEVTGDTIAVELTATDDRAVTEMELLVNGRPFAAKPIRREAKPIPLESKAIPTAAGSVAPKAKPIPIESKPIPRESRLLLASHKVQQRFQALVPLPPGEKNVTLKALVADDEDLQGWTEIRLARRLSSPVMGDLHVLSVGVSQYRDARFNLKYAARDAEAFANLWKPMEGRLYQRVIVTRVTDAQATAANVRAALVRVIHLATARDGVALFLSGHGIVYPTQRGEFYYFATHEVDPARVNDTALPWTVFQEALRKTRAKRVLLFLDACHSGNSLGTRQANNEQLLGELLRRNTGVMVFASSRRSEFSYEVEAKQHGAFTAALVEAIAEGRADLDIGTGRDGVITSEEIQTYLRTRVPQLTGNLQTPICPLMGDFGEPFPLARLR